MDGGRPGGDHRGLGQVSAIAVDPSDASGNTVYVAGPAAESGRRPTS